MQIPKRGNIYSANEAYSEGWDGSFMRYLTAIKTGRGETGQRYTQRYIGSMVGDVSTWLYLLQRCHYLICSNMMLTPYSIQRIGASNSNVRRHLLLPI